MANERILVVDDEKGIVRSCVRILERQGYIVFGKTESQSVPELLQQETFDLLLLDIKMPYLDGLELLQIAREIDPHLTVVLITGHGTMEDAIRAIQLGAQGFLLKPFEPTDLVVTIKDSLARRALIRDSLRLHTLLPLLEINQMLQVSGGETSPVRRVLKVVQRETDAARIAWLNHQLDEMAVAPSDPPPSQLPPEALQTALKAGHPHWLLAEGSLITDVTQPNIIGALLPLKIKEEIIGLLTAETGVAGRNAPFDPISLDLLSLLAGQLAIIIKNAQLFQQTEALRTFNEDIIQNMTNGLIAIDRAGRITAFNPAAARMLGYRPQEMLNQPLNRLTANEELARVFQKTLATGESHAHQELTVHHRDGSPLPVSVSAAPLRSGAVGVLEDLSELKALENERRRLDRLAALGQMSAVVAHEIRNPIAGIGAGIEYLARYVPEDSADFAGVAMIQNEIERVNRILEDILFVARPLRLSFSSQGPVELIQSAIHRSQRQIEQNDVTVTFQPEEDLPPLYIDRQRLEQVLTNLINNALQAMPDGGQLLFELGSTDSRIEITVSDSGPGIPPETQPRIFEPFFTTRAKGTGLGLPIARRIIEAHQGTITVENRPTRFIIRLPIQPNLSGEET